MISGGVPIGGGALSRAIYEGAPTWPVAIVIGFGAGVGPRSPDGTKVRPGLGMVPATAVLGRTVITVISALTKLGRRLNRKRRSVCIRPLRDLGVYWGVRWDVVMLRMKAEISQEILLSTPVLIKGRRGSSRSDLCEKHASRASRQCCATVGRYS